MPGENITKKGICNNKVINPIINKDKKVKHIHPKAKTNDVHISPKIMIFLTEFITLINN